MEYWNLNVGESLIIEEPAHGIQYRVSVVRTLEDSNARLSVEVMGPAADSFEKDFFPGNDDNL